MPDSKYHKYQHLEKIGCTEVEDIQFGDCYIFPKIDGTNAHIWLDNGELKCGSRNRELSCDSDNAGFWVWCNENKETLIKVLESFPDGSHIYGEWLVPHSLKTYADHKWRNFYIFDIVVISEDEKRYIHYDEYSEKLKELEYYDFIPPLRIIKNPQVEDIEMCLKQNTYLIEDGKGVGEGVVVKNYQFKNKFGRVVWAKLVGSDFKEKHHQTMGAPVTRGMAFIEEKIVLDFLSDDVIEKAYANIVNDSGEWSSKFIQRLLGVVYHDFVRECIWEILKKNKNPKIDFKVLQRFTVLRVKSVKPELF